MRPFLPCDAIAGAAQGWQYPAAVEDAGTDYTYAFVRSAVPSDARILEIGCSDGALAGKLVQDAFSVIAIDADAGAVEAAKRRGVDAIHATWPDFDEGRFDAILFTRSLHHMDGLEACVEAAFDRLAPSGVVVVEDFDAAYSDEATLRHFAGLARLLRAAGVEFGPANLLGAMAMGAQPLLTIWRGDHDQGLHSAGDIGRALEARAARLITFTAAYFFRYVGDGADRQAIAAALLDHELELISQRKIVPLGRRFVARPFGR